MKLHFFRYSTTCKCKRSRSIILSKVYNILFIFRPKKNPVFRATRPYLSEPADPRLFLRKYRFFFVGVFIIDVSILKKTEPTLPKVFQTVALNTRFFFCLTKSQSHNQVPDVEFWRSELTLGEFERLDVWEQREDDIELPIWGPSPWNILVYDKFHFTQNV